MEIKVLGTGCPKCNKLEKLVKEILEETKIEADIKKVTDINEIARAGVMLTPALVVNGEVRTSGKVPSKEELKIMITGQ
ncbi:MAG TPA: thioredoxin family protein [Firmicutes bacterium]|nr:thioredoxin family protein [Bacillota bacterium]